MVPGSHALIMTNKPLLNNLNNVSENIDLQT